jgi:hypothetical protein
VKTRGLLLLLAVMAFAAPAHSGKIRARRDSGYLERGILRRWPPDTCLTFVDFWTYHPAHLDTYGSFQEGDTVIVGGDPMVQLPDLYCGAEFWIHRNRIYGYHDILDLGCGVLEEHEDCDFFHSFQFGTWYASMGPFADGDTVRVRGRSWWDEGTFCEGADRGIRYWTELTTACADTSTAVRPTTWGRLRRLYR